MIAATARRTVGALVFALSVLWMTAAAAQAPPAGLQTVVAIGSGSIHRDDPTGARRVAIDRGRFTAVDLVVADLISVEAVVRHFEALNEIVYDNTDAFIQDFKVLAEWQSESQYRVMVQCSVAVDQVRARLAEAGIAVGTVDLPGVLFMMTEQTFPEDPPQFWWGADYFFARAASEAAMGEVFAEAGFTVIDHDAALRRGAVDLPDGLGPAPAPEAAVRLGAFFQAEVVVVGRASAEMAPNTMAGQATSFQGRVEATALRTDTGQVIATAREEATVVAADEITGSQNAIAEAGRRAGEALARRVTAAWQQADAALREVLVQVRGTQPLANFVKFRRMLGDLPGVEQVQAQEMDAETATIRLSLRGELGPLTDAMLQRSFDDFRINIYDVAEERIGVELIPFEP